MNHSRMLSARRAMLDHRLISTQRVGARAESATAFMR